MATRSGYGLSISSKRVLKGPPPCTYARYSFRTSASLPALSACTMPPGAKRRLCRRPLRSRRYLPCSWSRSTRWKEGVLPLARRSARAASAAVTMAAGCATRDTWRTPPAPPSAWPASALQPEAQPALDSRLMTMGTGPPALTLLAGAPGACNARRTLSVPSPKCAPTSSTANASVSLSCRSNASRTVASITSPFSTPRFIPKPLSSQYSSKREMAELMSPKGALCTTCFRRPLIGSRIQRPSAAGPKPLAPGPPRAPLDAALRLPSRCALLLTRCLS
mmetsp:Transcript_55474/g.171861  ORF Transcript_55474/g.171861 Transcript_55474/m.171861 type:complete len:278 (-) Transcript_55474:497-1330(-)